MGDEVLTVLIAATPPTLAAALDYLANRHSLRRSLGTPPGLPPAKVIRRVDKARSGRLQGGPGHRRGQARIRERLARLEGGEAGGCGAQRRGPGECQ